jgi:hypothetical protein
VEEEEEEGIGGGVEPSGREGMRESERARERERERASDTYTGTLKAHSTDTLILLDTEQLTEAKAALFDTFPWLARVNTR